MIRGIHYAEDLEKAIIGICLLEKDAYYRVSNILQADYFYIEDNQIIWDAITQMHNNSMQVDLLTLNYSIMEAGLELNCMKGSTCASAALSLYLMQLTNDVVSSMHLETWALILRNMWCKRKLEEITNSGIDYTKNSLQSISELHERIQLLTANNNTGKKEWYSIDEAVFELMQRQATIIYSSKKPLKLGFKKLDEMISIEPGDFIILGARPAVGKTAFAGTIELNIAKTGVPVGVINLEMNNLPIAGRLAAGSTGMDFQTIYNALFRDEYEQQRFYEHVTRNLIHYPIFLSDKTAVNIVDIRSKVKRLKRELKLRGLPDLGILIIDYLQLIDSIGNGRNTNREQEVSKISRGLKLIALEEAIPVIALCQLNRDSVKTKGEGRYPQPHHLRESGSLEQDADHIWMLHRDWAIGIETAGNGESTLEDADFFCHKQRNGSTFHLKMRYEGAKMRFSEKPREIFHKLPPPPRIAEAEESEETENTF